MAGMGDRVCVDLCSLLRPGEGLLVCSYILLIYPCFLIHFSVSINHITRVILVYGYLLSQVGSFARGLFLVHSECLESNYISSRPFRVNAVSFFLLDQLSYSIASFVVTSSPSRSLWCLLRAAYLSKRIKLPSPFATFLCDGQKRLVQ